MNNFVIMGPAGSGKGTQAKKISAKYGIPHISTGVIFRSIKEEDSELGRKVRDLIDKGSLVPDEITNEIVAKRVEEPDCNEGFILDGFPRNLVQAHFLENHKSITKCILVDVSDEECIKRMTARRVCSKCKADFNIIYIKPKQEGICDICGGELIIRDDDNPEAIKKRLEKFHNETQASIKFYEEKGVLLKVNGEQTIEKVFEEILKGLE